MNVAEAAILEKLVNGVAQPVAKTRHRPDGVGARPQMGDLPQEFEGMPFFLERISQGIGAPVNLDPFRSHFNGLPLARRWHDQAFDQQAAAGGKVSKDFPIALMVVFGDDLQILQA